MLVTVAGRVIEERAVHLLNVFTSILVTPSGIVTEVREEQPEKALFPILIILLVRYL